MSDTSGMTPYDRGLVAGDAWAKESTFPDQVNQVAEEGPGAIVLEYVYYSDPELARRLQDDPEAAEAFSEGFMHGVRAFLAEQR